MPPPGPGLPESQTPPPQITSEISNPVAKTPGPLRLASPPTHAILTIITMSTLTDPDCNRPRRQTRATSNPAPTPALASPPEAAASCSTDCRAGGPASGPVVRKRPPPLAIVSPATPAGCCMGPHNRSLAHHRTSGSLANALVKSDPRSTCASCDFRGYNAAAPLKRCSAGDPRTPSC